MPSLAELLGMGVKAGLDDNSFQQGYESQSKLAQLLKQNQLKQESIAANEARAQQQAQAMGLKPGSYSLSASEGGYGINPETSGLAALLDRQQARKDRERERLSSRATAQGHQEALSRVQLAEARTKTPATDGKPEQGGIMTNPNYEPKSAGFFANAMPQWMKNIGEAIHLMPEGASDEAQAIQGLVNESLRITSGSAVSAAEQGRKMIEMGMSAGGDPKLVTKGMQMLRDAIAQHGAAIQAGFDPEVVKEYKSLGGALVPSDLGVGQAGNGLKEGKTVVKRQRNPKTGQIRVVYSDGTTEIQ